MGQRMKNADKNFIRECIKCDSLDVPPNSYFNTKSTLWRKLRHVVKHEGDKEAEDVYSPCNCEGLHGVSTSGLSEKEVEIIKKVVERAESLRKADEIRIG